MAPKNKQHSVKIVGDGVSKPLISFSTLPKSLKRFPLISTNIESLNYKIPTPIQTHSIPILLKKRDLFGIAPTGSGKTAAFLIPAIKFCLSKKQKELNKSNQKITNQTVNKIENKIGKIQNFVYALIVSPTRELSHQIHSEAVKLSAGSGLEISSDSDSFENLPDILISTPYSLYNSIRNNKIDLKKVRYLVLDEGDRLLGESFNCKPVSESDKKKLRKTVSVTEQIDAILTACSHKKLQRSLFSATLPSHIETLARTVLRDPVRVVIGHREKSAESVDQKLMFVGSENSKLFTLKQVLNDNSTRPALIFVQSKKRAAELFEELKDFFPKVAVIHSGRMKSERDETIKMFSERKVEILICTDLMARGIDFEAVSLVLNFDFPPSVTEYIHRVGRSGRAGRRGKAVTFFTENDKLLLRSIAVVIERAGGEIPTWILSLDKVNRSRRKHLKYKPPKRKAIKSRNLIKSKKKKTSNE